MTETPAPPPPAPKKKKPVIHFLGGWRKIILWPFALILRAWGKSLRFEVTEKAREIFSDVTIPTVFLLWHNRLFLAVEFFRRFRKNTKVYSLVSASKDGAWLSEFFALVGMNTVRGSSNRNGHAAVRDLLHVLKEGHHIGITPDGPRGPLYSFKPGAYVIARRAHTRIIMFGAAFGTAWRLPSWDHLVIPLPFSRIILTAELIPHEKIASNELTPEALRDLLRSVNPDPADTTPNDPTDTPADI